MEERLGALISDGVPIVSPDNVNGPLGGDLLCQLVERPTVRVRILGQSKAPEFECRSTVLATGNNLALMGDMTRRTLLCSLDAGVEQPELREFRFDPFERVLAHRGAYVAAILTIVRAYQAAGSPSVCAPLGSYSEWSSRVRSPLVWLGMPDPVRSMEIVRADDPELTDIRMLFSQWRERLRLHFPYTARQVIELAEDREPTGNLTAPEFHELLLRRSSKGDQVSSRSLGQWLTSVKGRVIDGYRLEVQRDIHHGNRFSLAPIGERAE